MAMLAEPRRKQKWTLNPRGKQWSDDSNKFGQKMLEKMGWTSGKGLGANEQGVTDHVRVKYKDDQAGIGFSKNNQDKLWTEHQESFNALLQNLRTDKESSPDRPMEKEKDLTGKSLELKSKQSRARVHYQKFTRGKDVNKYSTKDLANIFGKKDLNEKKAEVEMSESAEKQSDTPTESTDVNGGVLTIYRGTMDDYFKQKMSTIPISKIKSENDGAAESESDGERYVGFGFSQSKTKTPTKKLALSNYSFVNPALDLNNSDDTIRKRKNEIDPEYLSSSKDDTLDGEKTPKKKRKTLKNYAFENPALDLACPEILDSGKKIKKELAESTICTDAVECIEQHNEDYEVKRETVGGVTSLQTDIIGHENDALDIADEVNGKKRVTFNDTIEYNTDSLDTNKKKHKKKRKKDSSNSKLDKFEVVLDKSAKKKLKNLSLTPEKNSFVNEALDVEVINEESVDNEENERKSNKTKKKKIRTTLNLDTIKEEDDVIEIGIGSNVENSNKCTIIEKKKTLNHDGEGSDSKSMDVTETDDCVEVSALQVNKKSKKLKKKKIKTELDPEIKIKNEIEDEGENTKENEDVGNSVDMQDAPEVKNKGEKKKKKKKKKAEECEVVDLTVAEADNEIQEVSNCTDDHGVDNNEVERHKISKPKKYFRTLFNQRPIANFIGSNINEIKGYGVES